MKLTFVGTGYVGLVSGVCFSELGHNVICVDNDQSKIERLNKMDMPIYEPGLKELVEKNTQAGRLSFTTDIAMAIKESDVIFIAVGTPALPNGKANLEYVFQVAESIGIHMNGFKIVVDKSTVPIGTADKVREIISSNQKEPVDFGMVSAPEFLREGSAVKDTLYPDRIILGVDSAKVAAIMEELHKSFNAPIVTTDIKSAEMIKYASNAFLATKITFINEIANICDELGANVTEVARGMGLDKRIGHKFLNAGIGFGGSCFPKDTHALIQIADEVEYDFKLLQAVVEVNDRQRLRMIDKLKKVYADLAGKTVAVWGLAFKPCTDDMRDAPATTIISELIQIGAKVKAYDPIAMQEAKKVLRDGVEFSESMYDAVDKADALLLVTEWAEFIDTDWDLVANKMASKVVIDGRNAWDRRKLDELGFIYEGIGI